MFTRISFFSITLVGLASLMGAILFSTQTLAWAPVVSPPDYTFDIAAAFDAQNTSNAFTDWRNMNYAIGEYSDSGTVLFMVSTTAQVRLTDSGTGYSTYRNSRQCRWTMDGSHLYGCDNASYDNNAPVISKLYALHFSQATIDANQTQIEALPSEVQELAQGGGGSNPLDPENDHTPQCQPWDVGCWFSGVIGNVVDGYQSLADTIVGAFQAMGDWIANLIMPSNADGGFDNRFTDFFTTVQETMTERLGFLLFPFEFISDLVASLTTIYNPFGGADAINGNCTSASQLAIPNLLGDSSVAIDLCGIEDTPIWEPAALLLRFVWIVGVVGFLHQKYFSVVKA